MYNRLRVSVIRRVYIWFLYVSVCERGEQRINKYMSGATSIPNYLLFELFCVCLRCSSSTESGCLFCTHTHTGKVLGRLVTSTKKQRRSKPKLSSFVKRTRLQQRSEWLDSTHVGTMRLCEIADL